MQSIISASFFISAAGILSLVAGFASSVIIARNLGADGTGLTALALWVAITGFAVANIGIPAIILRYVSRSGNTKEETTNFVRPLYRRFLPPILLFTAGFPIYALWEFYVVNLNTAFLWLFTGLIFLVYSQGQFVISADHGLGQFQNTTKKTALGCILQIPVTLLGAIYFGPAGAMAGYFARHLPQMFGLRSYLKSNGQEEVGISDQMRRYGQSTWFSTLLDQLVKTRIEFVFIGWFFGITELGYFAAGITFSSLILQLSIYLAAGMTPGFGRLFDDKALVQLRKSYDRSLRWLTMLLLPISLGGAVVMPNLIPLMFGPEFREAVPIASILVLFSLPQALTSVPLSAMLAFEKDRKLLYINGLFAALLIILNLVITPYAGGVGAAWIRGAVGLATFVWMIVHCARTLELTISLLPYLRILAAALCCALTAYAVESQLGGITGLVLSVAAGGLVYLVGLRITRAIPAEESDILKSVVERFAPASVQKHALRLISLLS